MGRWDYNRGPEGVEKQDLEASKAGMKVGRTKDPLDKASYFGIPPPAFIPPFEAPERLSPALPPALKALRSDCGLGPSA